MTRCRVGDLAVVVRSDAGNEGRIVRCVRLLASADVWLSPNGVETLSATWEIDVRLRSWGGEFDNEIADDSLRPINDPGDDARDQTLDWLPVPTQHKEHA